MKKYISLIFIVISGLCAIFSSTAQATTLFDYDINFTKEDFVGTVIMGTGQERFFIDGNEARGDKPFIEQDRTMAPLRTISEAFGAKVDWSAQENVVTITLNDQKIKLFLNSKDMYINGTKKELDVTTKAYNGRTYLPLRAIGEALGKSVHYIDNYRLIIIADSSEWIERYYQGSNFLRFEIFSCAIEGKKVFYGDDNFLVYYRDDGTVYLKDWSTTYKEYPFKSYDPYPDSPFHWYKVSDKEYLVFEVYHEVGDDCIYQFQDDHLKLIYSAPIFDIKFTNDYMYILASGPGIGAGWWFIVDEHSNLLKVNLQDYTEEYLGVKGFVYGCIIKEDSSGNTIFERDNWRIKDDSIDIYGLYDLDTIDERNNTTGRYKVSLTGQNHEKL